MRDNINSASFINISSLLGPRRRAEGGFIGSNVILSQLKKKPPQRRVGVIFTQGPPARKGASVLNSSMMAVGNVTSGCRSATLGSNIAMAYVNRPYSKIGTKLTVQVRKKMYDAEVTKLPFVSTSYFTKLVK